MFKRFVYSYSSIVCSRVLYRDLYIHLFFARCLRSVFIFFSLDTIICIERERERKRVIRTAEIVVQSYDYYDAWFNLDACFALFLLVSFFFFFFSFFHREKTDHKLFADGIKVLYNYSILVDYVWKNMNATNNKQDIIKDIYIYN